MSESELIEKNTPLKRTASKRLGPAERARRDQEEALRMMGILGAGDSFELLGRRTRSRAHVPPTAPATPPPPKRTSAITTPKSGRGKPKRLHVDDETDSKESKIKKISSSNKDESIEKEKSIEKNFKNKIRKESEAEIEIKEESNLKNVEIKEDDASGDSEMKVISETQLNEENRGTNKAENEITDEQSKQSSVIKEDIVKSKEEITLENFIEDKSDVDSNKLDKIEKGADDVQNKDLEDISTTNEVKDDKVGNNIVEKYTHQLNAVESMEVDGKIGSTDKIQQNDVLTRKTSMEVNNEVKLNESVSSSQNEIENVQKVTPISCSTENLSVKLTPKINVSHEEKNLIEIENNKNESFEENNKTENELNNCEMKLTPPGEIATSQTCK